MNAHRKTASIVILSASIVGCASTPPPRELLGARAAFQDAQAKGAPALSPVELHEAKNALDAAERAYLDYPDHRGTSDVAYVALRRAELAESASRTAAAAQQKAKAETDLHALSASEVSESKQALTEKRQELTAERRERIARTGELANTSKALEAEKQARAEAEKRAQEAIGKLTGASGFAVKDEPARGTVITVPATSLFVSSQATLTPAAQKKLDAVAEALKSSGDRGVVVEGHTDNQGNEAQNAELSQKRAQAVRDYLVSRGVSASAIEAVGLGQSRPLGDNKSADGRAQNRRLEIVIEPAQ